MDRLILWDVDGTLLTTDGISGETMLAAMRQVAGPNTPIPNVSYAGRTDWRIIRESLPALAAAEVAERLPEFVELYVGLLRKRRAELLRRSQLFSGVRAALERLQGLAHQAPLTGNVAAAARLKLECVGLLPLLDLEAGAYGDDHHDRPALVSIAASRAERRYGRAFRGQQIVVVGDTPDDIACGKLNGARTVAVATGHVALDKLLAHEPDVALPNLADTDAVLTALLG